MFDYVRLSSVMFDFEVLDYRRFDCVRLGDCLGEFDCRTQSYSIARLRSITERSIGFPRNEERVGIKSKIYVFSFNYKA